MLFLSAFWIVYPVMAALPSSFGGFHDKFTFSPQTSSIVTTSGGPGRSVMTIWQSSFFIIFLFFLFPTHTFHFLFCLFSIYTFHFFYFVSFLHMHMPNSMSKERWGCKITLSTVNPCQNHENPIWVTLWIWFIRYIRSSVADSHDILKTW